jgi:transcriptional regulator with XRE-family HTH domain
MARTFSGLRLRQLRTAAGLSRRALAEHIGRSPAAVADYEAGRVTPSICALTLLAAALGRPVDDLFTGTPVPAGRR